MLKILSLGWGVQSWTIAAMVALGELEPIHAAIHADTYSEKAATYVFIETWQRWLEQHGVRVVTVGDPVQAVTTFVTAWTDIPAYTRGNTEKGGMLRRQCTQRWKIEPIRRFLRDEIEGMGITKSPGVVESWQGISMDEFTRMRTSDVQWISNRYPLVDRRMTRMDCLVWLEKHNLPAPPKSACVFCPFQNRDAWKELKRTGGEDWRRAVEVDASIRLVRPPNELFIHPSRLPLEDAVSIPEDSGMVQANLLDECDSGYCFV